MCGESAMTEVLDFVGWVVMGESEESRGLMVCAEWLLGISGNFSSERMASKSRFSFVHCQQPNQSDRTDVLNVQVAV